MCSPCQLPHDKLLQATCKQRANPLDTSSSRVIRGAICPHPGQAHMANRSATLFMSQIVVGSSVLSTEEIAEMTVPLSQGTLSHWGVSSSNCDTLDAPPSMLLSLSLREAAAWHPSDRISTEILGKQSVGVWEHDAIGATAEHVVEGVGSFLKCWFESIFCASAPFLRFSLACRSCSALPFDYTADFWCYFALLSAFWPKNETAKRNCLLRQPFCCSRPSMQIAIRPIRRLGFMSRSGNVTILSTLSHKRKSPSN